MRIAPLTNQDIIRYRQVSNKVIDTFTNKVLYKGGRAGKILKKVNQIGMINASLIDNGKNKLKFMYIA